MRHTLKTLITAAGVSLAAVSVGAAADLGARPVYKAPPVVAPAYSWTGFYIGGNVGYAWGDSDISSAASCPTGGCPYVLPANLAAFGAAGTGSVSPNGFTGGVQAGYNWQTGSIVWGIEADFGAFDLNSSRSAGGLVPLGAGQTFSVTTGVDTNWLLTARGRLGWTITPTALLYVTGGLAVTDLEVSNSYTDNFAVPPIAGASSARDTKLGWTVGAGLEWALWQNWTAKVEYLYLDFGSVSTTARFNGAGFANPDLLATSADLKANIVRVGVNYRF